MKVCTRCAEQKSEQEFSKNRAAPDGLSYMCKVCDAAKSRANALKRHYGISVEDWEVLWIAQDKQCPICETPLSAGYGTVVDHDHQTGAVRQLLCRMCNLGLGNFLDNPEAMERAAEYIRNHREALCQEQEESPLLCSSYTTR